MLLTRVPFEEVFGQVVTGMDVVDAMQQWDVIRSIRIWDGVQWIGTDER